MNRKDTLAVLALSSIWGSSYLFIAIGAESLPPITLVAIRLLIGAAALQIALRLRGIPLPSAPRTLAALAFMGLTNNIIPFTLITWAETPGPQQINSGLAAVLTAAAPIFTVIIAHFTLKDERFTALKVSGVLLGFTGVVVLMSLKLTGFDGDQSLLGALGVVGAAVSYAVAIIFARRVLSKVPPMVIGAMQMTWGTFLLMPLALLVERPSLTGVTAQAWFAVAWLGVLGSGIAYILFFGLVQSIGATRTTIVAYLMPIVAVILGAIFNNESIHWTLIAGMVLIIGGAAIVNRKPKPRSAPSEVAVSPATGAR
ncbi:MAG: DMT family transporter [Anaerolineae bacterium]